MQRSQTQKYIALTRFKNSMYIWKSKSEWKGSYETGKLFPVNVTHNYYAKFIKYIEKDDQEHEYLNRRMGEKH